MIDIAEAFAAEAEDVLEKLENTLLGLEEQPEDREQIDAAFRALHTLKGSGAMAGFSELERFTHRFETEFDKVRSGSIQLSPDLLSISLESLDHIRGLIQAGPTAPPEMITASDAILQRFGQGSIISETPAPTTDKKPASGEIWGISAWRIELEPEPELLLDGLDPVEIFEQLRALGDCHWVGRIPDSPSPLDSIQPGHIELSWSILLLSHSSRGDIDDTLFFLSDRAKIKIECIAEDVKFDALTQEAATIDGFIRQQQWPHVIAILTDTPIHNTPQPTQETTNPSGEKSRKKNSPSQNDTIKIRTAKLDSMVNIVGELVTAQARLHDISSQIKSQELTNISENLERSIGLMRDATLDLRMIPVSGMFAKYKRLIRDISKQLGKKIQLETHGDDTELDKTVIDALSDPLVHLIRNSLDHGIEHPGERVTQGKPEFGTIKIRALNAGAKVLIEVQDDGKGLNTQVIREKAIERGVISAHTIISETEACNLIFAPGFSTASEVSALSGRGVGMDAVRAAVHELGGEIYIKSTLGVGTTMSIELPVTLAIIDGLVIRLGNEQYVLPSRDVEECINTPPQNQNGRCLVQVREELVPYYTLRDWFQIDGELSKYPQIIIAESQGHRVGLMVDEVIGQQQAVVKSLGSICGAPEGVSGATILGDGGIALVLDPSKLGEAIQREYT